MNRIKISPLATASSPTSQQVTTKNPLQHFDKLAKRSNEECSLFVPMHYEKNYAYPLIVWLHPDGEKPDQVSRVVPQSSIRNYVGVAPQGPVGNFKAGYFWEQQPDTIDMAHDSIMAAIDYASMRFNIASHRIFIAGQGTGGTMAFRIALERPDIFAGVISINGPMPIDEKPLGQWSRCREIPVFWAHSRKSTEFAQEQLCEQLRLLHIAGFGVTLRQYPSSDCFATKTLSDMNKWIMEMIDSAVQDNG
ncbi:MAG: alpha/beta hydrolase [Mariniblastus sp.]